MGGSLNWGVSSREVTPMAAVADGMEPWRRGRSAGPCLQIRPRAHRGQHAHALRDRRREARFELTSLGCNHLFKFSTSSKIQ
jgi:hypothetical protein